jgi:hypothetical protein
MTSQIPLREQLLRFFDQYDRRHPGTFTSAGAAAVAGSDSTAAYQAIREMAYGGVLALTTMPVTVVDNATLVRITNKGRALCGESAKDQTIRNRVLRYIDTHATSVPTPIETCPHDLDITELEASRAIVSLAEEGLITHKRVVHSLGMVKILPSGHKLAATFKG